MSTNADNLLESLMEGEGETVSNSIILTVDESTRKILYSGELILGVEDDHQAERIYFKLPRYVGRTDVFDLSSDTVTIGINFENAYKEPYIYECIDKTLDGDYVTCSWLLTEQVTQVKGTVNFIVCAKNVVDVSEEVKITESLTSDSVDEELGTMATFTKPNSLHNYNIVSGVVTGYIKENGRTEYTLGSNVEFDIFINDSEDEIISKYTDTNGEFTSTSEQLALLANAKTISIKCTNSPVVGDSDLNSTYYRVIFDFVIEGTDIVPSIINEWHTTPFEAKVLKGIDVSQKTPNVIISNEISSIHKLQNDIADLNDKLNNAVIGYSKAEINNKFATLEDRLISGDDSALVVAKAENATNAENAENATNAKNADNATNATYATYDSLGYNISRSYEKAENDILVLGEWDNKLFYSHVDDKPLFATKGNIFIANFNFDIEASAVQAGDVIRVFVDGGSNYPTCQSGVIELQLYPATPSPTAIDAQEYVLVGRNCFVSTLGGQSMIIGAEFILGDIATTYRLAMSVYALSDLDESNTTKLQQSEAYLRRVIRYRRCGR